MGSDEAFCLKWNDFQENISSSLGPLLACSELQDVTLQCGPHTSDTLQCHRLVLAVCSDWFRNIFKSLTTNNTKHPVIVLWDTAVKEMSLLLDFMYHGEVNVKQENLNSFLALAERLSVRGLTQNDPQPQSQSQSQSQSQKRKSFSQNQAEKKRVNPVARVEEEIEEVAVVKVEQPREVEFEEGGEVMKFEGGYDLDYYETDQTAGMEYDTQETSNIVNSKGYCEICNREYANIHQHRETHDFNKQPVHCPHCRKVFSTKNSMRVHKSLFHREALRK